jgi:hypothetical protein
MFTIDPISPDLLANLKDVAEACWALGADASAIFLSGQDAILYYKNPREISLSNADDFASLHLQNGAGPLLILVSVFPAPAGLKDLSDPIILTHPTPVPPASPAARRGTPAQPERRPG